MAIICLISMCCLKCMSFEINTPQWWQVYSKSFSCLLLLWRVKFLAEFTFSSQWLHMKCFDLAIICVILHASSFLDFLHYVCLQWLHVYWFSYNCVGSCEQESSTLFFSIIFQTMFIYLFLAVFSNVCF